MQNIEEVQPILVLYADLMEELKIRFESINTITNDQRGIPSPLIREYCFLQARMVCEIVALACLVAHGDIIYGDVSKLKKAYEPGVIIKKLEALHPDFFPVPVSPIQTPTGWHLGDYIGGEIISKEMLIEFWAKSGDVLHRGNLNKLIKAKSSVQKNFAEVNEFGQKTLNLLSNHRIMRKNGLESFVVFLKVNQLSGAVQVAFGAAPPPNAH